jgi:TRAP transporter TAXI family solute receptor
VTLLTLTFAACGGGDDPPLPAEQVRVATGQRGGVYRVYGKALADLVNRYLPPLRASAQETQGSVENLQRLGDGRADVAFTLADSAAPALRGTSPFSRPIRLAALAHLYDDYVQVIARASSHLKTITDLHGRTVSIGPPRSGTALTARRILELPGLGLRGARAPRILTLALRASANALAAGRIDAFFWSGGLPTNAIVDLKRMMLKRKQPIRWLALPARTAEHLDPNLYAETVIPQFVYGPEGAVRTVTAANLLVVRKDLPDAVAFRLTGLLFKYQSELERAHQEARRLNKGAAITTYPLDLHPGAERWYRENP